MCTISSIVSQKENNGVRKYYVLYVFSINANYRRYKRL